MSDPTFFRRKPIQSDKIVGLDTRIRPFSVGSDLFEGTDVGLTAGSGRLQFPYIVLHTIIVPTTQAQSPDSPHPRKQACEITSRLP